MLFNLQNLPFLGHVRSFISLFKCPDVITYAERFLNGLAFLRNPSENIYIEGYSSGVPINTYFFDLNGRLDPTNTTVYLDWTFDETNVNLGNSISYFEVRKGVLDLSDPTLTTVDFAPLNGSPSQIPFRGEGSYSLSFPFSNNFMFDNSTGKAGYYKIEAYDANGQCLLLQSNICFVFPIPKTIIPLPPPVIPAGCIDDTSTTLPGDVLVINPRVTVEWIDRDGGGRIFGYESYFRVEVELNASPGPDAGTYGPNPFGVGTRAPIKLELQISRTGPTGAFNSLSYFSSLPDLWYTMFINQTSVVRFGQIALAGFVNEPISLRVVATYDRPNSALNLAWGYQVVCVGSVIIPPRPPPIPPPLQRVPPGNPPGNPAANPAACGGATIAPVPTIAVAKRELVAGIFSDPCTIYQYIELVLPPETYLVSSPIRIIAPGRSVQNDLDGTANPGFFGATSISPCGAPRVGSPVGLYFDPLFDQSSCAGGARGSGYSIPSLLPAAIANAYAYRDIAGNYIPKTPGTASMLVRMGSYASKAIVVNGQDCVMTRNDAVINISAQFYAKSGTVFNKQLFCQRSLRATYFIALQTAEEVNDFYRTTRATKAACLIPAASPRFRRVNLRGPRVAPRLVIAQDAHLIITKVGGALRQDSLLLIDDNSSPNKINYFYLKMENGGKHLITLEQKAITEKTDPDWADSANNPCVSSSGFLISDAFYYTGKGTGDFVLVGDASSLIASSGNDLIIEDKFGFSIKKHHLTFPDLSSSYIADLSYESYSENFESVIVNGHTEVRPITFSTGYQFSGVSEIGGIFYHITKKMGNYPSTSLPYFCYGEGLDGVGSFIGTPRAFFETGYLEEQPDANKIINFIEIIGGGTGSGIQGADIFDTNLASCGSSLCFDPLIAKRGMVKISTAVSAGAGKRFKGIMNASVHEVSDPNNPVHITNFYFVQTGGTVSSPEIDVTEFFAKETGILTPSGATPEDGLMMICSGCGNARVSGHTNTGSSVIEYTLLHENGGFTFFTPRTGRLRFSGVYDIYAPTSDCLLTGVAIPTYQSTQEHIEYLGYQIDDSYVDFFCVTGSNCDEKTLHRSLTHVLNFSGIPSEPEGETFEVAIVNTGLDTIRSSVRRLVKTGESLYHEEFESINGDPSNGVFDMVLSDNPLGLPPEINHAISGNKTGYINKYIYDPNGTAIPNPYAKVYRGNPGSETKMGEEFSHSFVSFTVNTGKSDSVGREITVISDFPGDSNQLWESELKHQYTGHYGELLDHISELDDISFRILNPTADCGRLVIPIPTDPINLDYKPVQFHVKNESDLPIHIDIGTYVTKLNRGAVDAEGGTGSALFGNSGRYIFGGGMVAEQEVFSPPYLYSQIAKKAVVGAGVSGYKFFLDPNAHFVRVDINRLFPNCRNPLAIDTHSYFETYVISRTGVPTYILDSIKSENSFARVLEMKGFHPNDSRRDIEFAYKESKVLLESKTLTLNADTYNSHTGEVDTSIITAGSIGYGSTASGAEDDANDGYGNAGPSFERCFKVSWIPNIDIGKFDNITKSLLSVNTVENAPNDFTSTKQWALSGYINNFKNFNTNPSMYLTGVNFGRHTGYHFLIKPVGGYLQFSGKEDGIPYSASQGFHATMKASGTGVVGGFASAGEFDSVHFSSVLGAYIHYDNQGGLCNSIKRYRTFDFNSTGQVLITSMGAFPDGCNLSLWDAGVGGDVSQQNFIDIVTGSRNDFLFGLGSEIPNSFCDYKGLYRSFNETEFYLKTGENKFSGIFLNLSGISIPASGELINIGGTLAWNDYNLFAYLLYMCNESPSQGPIATYTPTGTSITVYRNYRGKDFYDVSAAHVTSGEVFNEASGFNVMKNRVSGILVNSLGLTGIEEHYNFLNTARSFESPPNPTGYHAYTANLLYSKNHKVIPSSNATFELYRIDHVPEIRLLNGGVIASTAEVEGPLINGRSECLGSGFFRGFDLRLVNNSQGFTPTSYNIKFYKDGVLALGGEEIPFPSNSNVGEFFGASQVLAPCIDNIVCTVHFTPSTGGQVSISGNLPVNVVGSVTGAPLMGVFPSSNLTLNLHPISGLIEIVPFPRGYRRVNLRRPNELY